MSAIKEKLKMNNIIKFLRDKKTYVVAGIFVILNALQFFNVITLTQEALSTIDLVLAGVFGLTMRAAIKKVQNELGIKIPEK